MSKITDEVTKHQGEHSKAINEMQEPISRIIINYKGWGKTEDIDHDFHPENEIKNFLNDLEILFPGRDKKYLKLAIREKITKLACFQWRVLARDKKKTIGVWDPLNQAYFDFLNSHNGYDISYKLTRQSHPAEDIINDWVDSKLPRSIFL